MDRTNGATNPLSAGRIDLGSPTSVKKAHPLTDGRSLSGVRTAIRGDLTSAGADADVAFDCLVAVTEACSNALEYGRPRGDERAPEISWVVGSRGARFEIRDFSLKEWSRAVHPSRDRGEALRDRGYGFELMHGLMDEVEIGVHRHGTVVILSKRFSESLGA